MVAPEVVDQPLAGDRLPGVQGQPSQEGSFEGPGERDTVTVGVDLYGTEQSDGDHGRAPCELRTNDCTLPLISENLSVDTLRGSSLTTSGMEIDLADPVSHVSVPCERVVAW